jgi:UDP-N-acetylglucosamine 1-carboxyvinyltransferase
MAGPNGPTVTGTANVLCAATLARGRTIITGAATEPEIVDLGNFLNRLGARIQGLGTSTLEILGVQRLAGGSYSIIPDRIETATLLVAAAITGGSVEVTGVAPEHLAAVLAELDRAGLTVAAETNSVRVASSGRLRPMEMSALPYPGVPTDVQAQFMALACVASGRSTVRDCVFPERFRHVDQLRRFGAQIEHSGDRATIDGVARLRGANVTACDLRASAALVLAGLAAEGETTVRRVYHLDRGYQRLEQKLALLGADIERASDTTTAQTPSSSARDAGNSVVPAPHLRRIPGLMPETDDSQNRNFGSNYFDPR